MSYYDRPLYAFIFYEDHASVELVPRSELIAYFTEYVDANDDLADEDYLADMRAGIRNNDIKHCIRTYNEYGWEACRTCEPMAIDRTFAERLLKEFDHAEDNGDTSHDQ